jgi:hypothetical protein
MEESDCVLSYRADGEIRYGDVVVNVRGNCLTVTVANPHLRDVDRSSRGEVGWFSKASRLRLLRLTSSMDRKAMGRCSMLSLTWPDWIPDVSPERRTLALSLMQRHVERLSREQRPGVWRVEWEIRKSGRRRKQLFPHIHVLYYNAPWLDKLGIEAAWQSSLSSDRVVRTRIEEERRHGRIQMYISKYLAKPVGRIVSLSLSHTSADGEVIRPGRTWGCFRRGGLPWAKETEVVLPVGDARIDALRDAARGIWDGVSADPQMGFTLLGPRGPEAAQKILNLP